MVYGGGERAPLRWHTVFTTGDPLMLTAIPIATTTLAQEITYAVPDNERWLVFNGFIRQSTLSSGTAFIIVEMLDENDYILGTFISQGVASGVRGEFPGTGNTANVHLREQSLPYVLYEGQKIKFYWAASANASGTNYHYINVLKFKTFDQI